MTTQIEINKKALELIKIFGSKEIAIKATTELRLELKYNIPDSEERDIRFYYWVAVMDALNEL